ncbi:hypothetical protein [Gaoshiqia sediminis]|uniref:NHL repeat containing protein n=1 Tax=Gaoshiqia sediminis TaxID=2986998 RepID=A0AA41Y788_9BACT|nr:hypothetical protein [Gaoshiqia sediminis]MCW0482188.1 hypothetical protein [Gaoshiqia sediminis]
MKNRKYINHILAVMAIFIAGIIVRDFFVNRSGKNIDNPYAYDISEFAQVDPSEVIYKEVKALRLSVSEPKGIAFADGIIYVIADSSMIQLNESGQLIKQTHLEGSPTAIAVNEKVWLAFTNRVVQLDKDGNVISRWQDYGERAVITSLAVSDQYVYVADAGNRLVYQCRFDGELVRRVGEKDEQKGVPGFVVPSPYFDIALSDEGFLWAVDPGRHSLENFNADGAMRTSWTKSSVKTEGFSGCCNPAHMTILADNLFVTSEKGIVRVKIYDQHGEYVGVVASPDQFDEDSYAPDVCVDENNRVILLDFNRKQVRIFEPLNNEQ